MAETSDSFETFETAAEPDDPEPQQTSGDGESTQPELDIEALAEKVYRLMMAEIRLDRARGLASEDGG